ncbi:hypothetical protein TI39_contig4392g00003 [Zymoseptoria brevis]|uniref:SRR1-like domain-containing protein n=1 Tax=Zymoseptoria brevis TaxID=1047168 RepID=A0A0F4G6Y1_9PEZI|nr:hypothetical protein TI39_contig4392g00003 [Zymoseptoria brevis]
METTKDEAWTHIPAKGKRKTKSTALLNPSNPPARDLTLEKLNLEFQTKTKAYRQTTCHRTVTQILDRIRPDSGWKLNKALCLGIGSLSRENFECRRRTMWQFVVFHDLVEQMRGEGLVLEVFAQEPSFTELDVEFLDILGVKVLETRLGDGTMGLGLAKEQLGEGTLVYEPFIDMNAVMLEELMSAGVGLYVGSSIGGILGRRGESEASRLVDKFRAGREMLRFPRFDIDPNVFDGIQVYWTEEKDDQDD